jgi:hypothetical protein
MPDSHMAFERNLRRRNIELDGIRIGLPLSPVTRHREKSLRVMNLAPLCATQNEEGACAVRSITSCAAFSGHLGTEPQIAG